ncbi:MAG TPA: M1 family aminopeptidase [Pyrinomonadaceae bacterium]|jgi:aminopeptidase N|nr:M1 family aminopeptidase [Pyrinomonadaceae bacterium]
MNLEKFLRWPLSLILLVFVCVPCLAALSLPVGDPAEQEAPAKKLPPANWIRSRQVDIKHIAIDLRFDWQKKQASGTTAITLAPFNPTSKITLDAGMLTINSISLSDGMPLKFNYDGGDKNDGLEILLDRVYPAGADLTVKIDYHTNWINESDPNNLWGSFGRGIRFMGPTSTDPKKRKQLWTFGEPESNRYWFPGYDSPNDFRTSELTATVDNGLIAISNGSLVETKNNADGTRSFHWRLDVPHANYLTSLVVGEYVDIKQNYDGIELHSFGYPDEAEAVAATVVRLPDMIKFYSELTGVKYPYPSYSQTFVQDSPGWNEGITASTITENMVDDERTHAEWFYLWDLTEAETLAHQWFGNYLTCRDWSQIWLNKSFAHHLTGLYNEHKNGRDEYLLYQVTFDQSVYLSDWNSGNRHPVVTRNFESAPTFTSENYTTGRGSLVLRMLRKHLGDDRWQKVLKQYVRSNANKSVSTEDFRKAVEEASGESMEWFFEQWLYKMGHPIFAVTKSYDNAAKRLTLNVKQTQKVDPKDEYPQVEFFTGKLEIEIDGRIATVWVEPKAENVFAFAAAQEPKLVNFDYESTWIKEVKFEKTLDELLYQLQNDQDILGRRWAMAELVNLARNDKTAASDKTKVYAALRNVVLGNSYWRLRNAAISQLQALLAPASLTTPAALDEATIAMLSAVIKNEKTWNRFMALNFLGMTRDPKFADLYISYLNDPSDRVTNAAAIALGRSKSPKAFDALAKLVDRPSWKKQSLISALNGLAQLGDPRGYDIAFKALSDLNSPHWTLATPVWDYRLTAAQTIAALGKSDAAYPLLAKAFKDAVAEKDIHGTFYNALLITTLADRRGQEAFDVLKAKFKDDANAMSAVNQFETQFKQATK